MTTLLLTVFLASLLGNLHCVLMCGHFLALDQNPVRFHLTRLLGYLALAGILFFLKDSLLSVAKVKNLERYFALLISLLLMFVGFYMFIKNKNFRFNFASRLKPLQNFFVKNLGLSVAFMPCSWLWLFLFLSFQQETWLSSAMVIFSFWLGTLPLLLIFKKILQFRPKVLNYSYRSVGILFIFLGCWQLKAKYWHSDHVHGQNAMTKTLFHSLKPSVKSPNYCAPLETE
jgi:sulfite exporter TauE/SafE